MSKSTILITSLCFAALLWTLNQIALVFYFYWTLAWYDIMMHFLGGLTIGVFLICIFRIANISTRSFLVVFLLAMFISIDWEIFEYVNDIVDPTENYAIDTAYDLVMDALGITAAYLSTNVRKPIQESS